MAAVASVSPSASINSHRRSRPRRSSSRPVPLDAPFTPVSPIFAMHPEPSNDCCGRPEVTALLLAAGSGTRLGGIAKATLEYKGGSLLQHAIGLLAPFAARLVVGVREADLGWAQEQCAGMAPECDITIVSGGA